MSFAYGATQPQAVVAPAEQPVKNRRVPVRAARIKDVDEIADIHVRSWQAAYAGLIPQSYLDSLAPAQRVPGWTETIRNGDSSRGGTLVATDDRDRAVGFAHVRESRDDDTVADRVGEVWAIYLAPEAWGTGAGRALMTAAVGRLVELGYLQATLWVLDGNARARRFYEAAGFRLDGAVKDDDSRDSCCARSAIAERWPDSALLLSLLGGPASRNAADDLVGVEKPHHAPALR